MKARFVVTLVAFCALVIFSQHAFAARDSRPPSGPAVDDHLFTVFGPTDYLRATAEPVDVEDYFPVLNTNTDFYLRVYNRGKQGQFASAVSSAVIELNSFPVLGPNDFAKKPDFIEEPVALEESNEITVQLRSKPGSGLTVEIVGVDNEPPTIEAIVSPAANANGWHNTDVLVTFQCADVLSGIASCTEPVLVTTEGAGQVVTGTAVDNAGNSASTSVTLNIDKTPPTITAAQLPLPNAAGWNNTDVTVTFTGGDSLSGLASLSDPATVTTEGSGQVVIGTAVDNAGNSASASVTLNIDKTAPTITAAQLPLPNASGWNNTDVTVTFTGGDSLSGLASLSDPATVTAEGAGQVVMGTAVDNAGNSASTSATLNIDKTPPSIAFTSPTVASTTNQQPLFSVSYSDGLSGVVSFVLLLDQVNVTANAQVNAASADYTPPAPLSYGVHTAVAGIADLAGNSAPQASVQVEIVEDGDGDGDPVMLPTGKFVYDLTRHDIRMVDGGPAIDLLFTFRGHDRQKGVFGHGWHTALTSMAIVAVTDEANGRYVSIRDESGRCSRLRLDPNGEFSDPRSPYRALIQNAGGGYALVLKSGTVQGYEADGRIRHITDGDGRTLLIEYDNAGAIRSATSASGQKVFFTTGGNGNITAVTDPMAGIYVFSYDDQDNLVQVCDPLGNKTRYSYDSDHNLTRVVAPNGMTEVANVYDDRGRVTRQSLPQGDICFSYESPVKTVVTDPRGTTIHMFNASGMPTVTAYFDGRTKTRVWDKDIHLVSITEGGRTDCRK